MMAVMRTVPIRDDAIRLGQFLKLADLVGDGGEVKPIVASGEVLVNGEAEVRRGRRLAKGDVVAVRGEQARVG